MCVHFLIWITNIHSSQALDITSTLEKQLEEQKETHDSTTRKLEAALKVSRLVRGGGGGGGGGVRGNRGVQTPTLDPKNISKNRYIYLLFAWLLVREVCDVQGLPHIWREFFFFFFLEGGGDKKINWGISLGILLCMQICV